MKYSEIKNLVENTRDYLSTHDYNEYHTDEKHVFDKAMPPGICEFIKSKKVKEYVFDFMLDDFLIKNIEVKKIIRDGKLFAKYRVIIHTRNNSYRARMTRAHARRLFHLVQEKNKSQPTK